MSLRQLQHCYEPAADGVVTECRFAAGPGSGGISVDPVRDFLKRQQQEREAQKVQQAKDELDEWLRQEPDLNDQQQAPTSPTRPSHDGLTSPEPRPTPAPSAPSPAAVPLADDASISDLLDQSTAKNLLAFLPTILFWFAVALSTLLLSRTLHLALPYAIALTSRILAIVVWPISKAFYWSSRGIVGLLWLVAWLSRVACWTLLLAWPVVAWVGSAFLLPRGSGLRRLSLLVPPPTWFVLTFVHAPWWLTRPVAWFALARIAVALARGSTRREAAGLAVRVVLEGWAWLAQGGIQRQWQQVLYGWESANPNRHAEGSSAEPTAAAAAAAAEEAAAPPTKPVPDPASPPGSPKSSPKRMKKPNVG